MRNEKVQKLTLTALMAALSYVIFTFLQIKVTLPGGSTKDIFPQAYDWCYHRSCSTQAWKDYIFNRQEACI